MALGLKRHTHADREQTVRALVPLIAAHMGDALIGLAASGSFARGSDGAYSDIELVGFVRETLPGAHESVNFIVDGLLLDLWFITPEQYLDRHKRRVTAEWPYAAARKLIPLLNETLVRELDDAVAASGADDCRWHLTRQWLEVQEATGKVLTAADRGDLEVLPLLYVKMVEQACLALSFLNARPYTTRAAVLAEVRAFDLAPPSLPACLTPPPLSEGPLAFDRQAKLLFEELEALLLAQGLELYAPSLEAFFATLPPPPQTPPPQPEAPPDAVRARPRLAAVLARLRDIGRSRRIKAPTAIGVG